MLDHIQNVVEALRGKTRILQLKICVNSEIINVNLKDSFLDFISWKYPKLIESKINENNSNFDEVYIKAKQVFAKDSFEIIFRNEEIKIVNKQNIEETLYLDIFRYIESKKIKVIVNEK